MLLLFLGSAVFHVIMSFLWYGTCGGLLTVKLWPVVQVTYVMGRLISFSFCKRQGFGLQTVCFYCSNFTH